MRGAKRWSVALLLLGGCDGSPLDELGARGPDDAVSADAGADEEQMATVRDEAVAELKKRSEKITDATVNARVKADAQASEAADAQLEELSHTTTLKVGDEAPRFKLKADNKQMWKLTKALKKGPVLLIFYRGHW